MHAGAQLTCGGSNRGPIRARSRARLPVVLATCSTSLANLSNICSTPWRGLLDTRLVTLFARRRRFESAFSNWATSRNKDSGACKPCAEDGRRPRARCTRRSSQSLSRCNKRPSFERHVEPLQSSQPVGQGQSQGQGQGQGQGSGVRGHRQREPRNVPHSLIQIEYTSSVPAQSHAGIGPRIFHVVLSRR